MRFLRGTTVRFTWTQSGTTPSSISACVRNGVDAVVSSHAAVSSGNGHYFAMVTLPNTPGCYVNEWASVVDGYPYFARQSFRVVTGEVD